MFRLRIPLDSAWCIDCHSCMVRVCLQCHRDHASCSRSQLCIAEAPNPCQVNTNCVAALNVSKQNGKSKTYVSGMEFVYSSDVSILILDYEVPRVSCSDIAYNQGSYLVNCRCRAGRILGFDLHEVAANLCGGNYLHLSVK